MERDRERLSINAAKLYYHSGYSQQDIARELGISRPSVSRLLQHAKDQGYVKIQIFDPVEDMTQLERRLTERYGLREACVAAATINDEQEIKKYLGRRAARYLDSIVHDGDIIGVGWGTTMHTLAASLLPHPLKGAQIVQLEGGVTHTEGETYANDILERFAGNFATIAQHLPLPVIFDSRAVKEMVDQDRYIKRVLELGSHANIAVYSVGTVRHNALFFRLGYTDVKEKARLQESAVGDICSRFFDIEGNICDAALDNRTVGIKLAELRRKEHSIIVAGGEAKVLPIRAALAGRYGNVLITDQFTAQALLDAPTGRTGGEVLV